MHQRHLRPATSSDCPSSACETEKLSLPDDDMTIINSCQISRSRDEEGPQLCSILTEMRISLKLLQIFGFIPEVCSSLTSKDETLKNRIRRNPCRTFLSWILKFYTLALMAVNGWFFKMCVEMIYLYRTILNLPALHALVVVPIVTSLKPIIAMVELTVFLSRLNLHKALMRQLESVHEKYGTAFGSVGKPIRNLNFLMIAGVSVAVALGLGWAAAEHVMMQKKLNIMNALAFVGIPGLAVWNILPLIYFHQLHILIRLWGQQLKTNITRNFADASSPPGRPLKFFYQRFMDLADLQMNTGEFLNPYIAFSFVWSVFVLCFTIYFLVNAGESFGEPPFPFSPEEMVIWNRSVIFHIGWLTAQTTLALIHFLTICNAGRKTNEETRSIIGAVLGAMKKYEPNAKEHVYIHCFELKTRLQGTWGATIWRALPLERSAFLQMTTMIMSYAIILIKFRGSPDKTAASVLASNNTLLNNSTLLNSTIS